MRIVAWQVDFQDAPSVVEFVEVPVGGRPLFTIAEEDLFAGHVIADIDGAIVGMNQTSFADWCRSALRGRGKLARRAQALAIERGWMPAPRPRSKV